MKDYTVFIGGNELNVISADDAEICYENNTIKQHITVSTTFGDIEFTGVFTQEQWFKYITVCKKAGVWL